MKPSDEFFTKLANLWFYKEPPTGELSDSVKRWLTDMIKMFMYGEDSIYSHPKINEIIQLFKDFGIVDYSKNIRDLYFEGKMRVQVELREAFNSPMVTMELNALANVLGDLFKKIEGEVKKQIEKEKNASAIPQLRNKDMFKN